MNTVGRKKVKSVEVLNLRGMLLQNTTVKRAQELLDEHKARLIKEQPLVIQLLTPTGEAGLQNVLVKPKKHYTVKEVAKLLRYSTSTIYRQIKTGIVPAERREGNLFVPGDWLQQQISIRRSD